MSIANPISPPLQAGRRSHARYKIDSVAYVDFGPDNGAILIDLGEGGLGFQSVLPVSFDHALLIKLKLPWGSIESYAEVTWLHESGKCGGLRFVDLSSQARAQIRDCTDVAAASQARVEVPPALTAGGSDSVQQGATEHCAGAPTRQSAALQSIMGGEPPAQASHAFAEGENGQEASVSPEISDELRADEAATEQIPAEQVLADLEALPIPGFMHGPVEGAADSTLPLAAPATPARAVRLPASGSKNYVPAQEHKATPAPLRPASHLAASRQDSRLPRSFVRQSQTSPPTDPHWSKQATPGSQLLRVGIGAAAGTLLVLVLVVLLPFLRTRVLATANPKSSSSDLPNPPVFEVEVADLSNHRWILTGGGEAASPFRDVPLLTGTNAAASASRSKSAEELRSDDYKTSNDMPNKSQPELATPGKLGLPRPHAPQAAAPPAQVVAPSIFEGITPTIGSMSEYLSASRPDATQPGIVPPQSQARPRPSALQAAVLLKRVEPIYPKIALASRVMGQVRLSATIGRDGVPRDIKVISGNPRLVEAALTAISQWRYRPATLGGEAIETQTIVNIDFELH